MTGVGRTSTHNRAQTAGPSDVYRTRDGWVLCAVIGPAQFAHWCEMVGRPELVDDERFVDDLARGEHADVLSAYMGAWCADRTTDEVLTALDAHRVPGGPVLDAKGRLVAVAFTHDPGTGLAVAVPIGTLRGRWLDFTVSRGGAGHRRRS